MFEAPSKFMSSINIKLTVGQNRTVALNPNPALPQGSSIQWAGITSPGVCNLFIAEDSMSARFAAIAEGRAVFAVYADAGENVIGSIICVDVIPNEPTDLNPAVN